MGDLRSGALDTQAKRGDEGNIIEQLRDIRLRLEERQSLTDDQSSLLADGLGRYLDALDDGNAPSLDMTLGLKSWGGISSIRRDRMIRRDRLLLDLWQTDSDWQKLSPGLAAKLMVQSAQRYEAARWHREQFLPQPTAQPTATWWQILSSGLKVPGARRLQQILENEIQDGV